MEDEEEMNRIRILKDCVVRVQSSLKSIVVNQKKQLEKDEEYQKKSTSCAMILAWTHSRRRRAFSRVC